MENVESHKKRENMLNDKKQSTYTVALFIVDEQGPHSLNNLT